ncbi:uncharacterized protein [Nicotiana sylvestris]|uniref:uncharacterized protein n=1 Tax=Nicotiana sylvestris TaxID=4096 RepID=UPI00388C5469
MGTESITSFPILQSPPTLIDSSHPLYVHPSDNPGVLLVSVPFSGTGYNSWRKNVLIALSAKNKAGLINAIPYPKDIVDSVLHCDTARDLWRDIEERYEQSNATCTCEAEPQCSDGQKLIHFLTGLNETYSNARSNILMMYPVPTLGKAYSILLHDESQREIQPSGGSFLSESASFSVKSTPSPAQFTNGPKSFPQKVLTSKGQLLCANTVKRLGIVLTNATNFMGSQGPSPRRPLEIGRAANGLYVIDSAATLPAPTSSIHNITNKRSVSLSESTLLVNNISNKALVTLCNYSACISTCNPDCPINKTDLFWHQRLGHMPFHRMKSIDFLSDKLSSKQSFICPAFVLMVKTHFNLLVQTIRSDNAFELGSSAKASSFFAEFGILHQTTIPQTPQQNGVVERKHMHLLETSRALLFQSKLPIKYWGDCVLTSTYLINRFPSTVLQNLSPYHKLHGHPPTYAHLRTFGCLCFATIPKVKRDKLQPKPSPSLFVGYPLGKKGYKLLDLANHSIFYSRDVVFHEHIFPYHSSSPPSGFPAISDPFVDSQASSYSPPSFAPPHSPIHSSHLLIQSSHYSLNQSSSHPSSPPLIPTAQPPPLRSPPGFPMLQPISRAIFVLLFSSVPLYPLNLSTISKLHHILPGRKPWKRNFRP